jgi:hypothetical protein
MKQNSATRVDRPKVGVTIDFLEIKRLWKMAMGRLPDRIRAERGQRTA